MTSPHRHRRRHHGLAGAIAEAERIGWKRGVYAAQQVYVTHSFQLRAELKLTRELVWSMALGLDHDQLPPAEAELLQAILEVHRHEP